MRYLREAEYSEAMATVYSGADPDPKSHTIWTGDFMGMAKHDIACPVCFDNWAMLCRDVTPGQGKQTIQPCWECQSEGYVIARVPRLLRWFARRRYWWRAP